MMYWLLHTEKNFLKCVIILSFIQYSSVSLAQKDLCTYEITGQVFDRSTEEPLAFATVQIEESSIGAITDSLGLFKLSHLCEKEFDLKISFIGYQTLVHHHDYHHPEIIVYLAPSSEILESIVIEADVHHSGSNTNTISRLEKEELDLVQSASLGDIMSRLPGVSVVKAGQNIASPMIHGLSGSRILIINDGVRHEFQNWDDNHAPEIDPSSHQNLEVIKGAATVRYGPDALGGVILLSPRHTELGAEWQSEINLIGKSNGRSTESNFSLSKGFQSFSIDARTSWLRQGDLHAPKYNLTNTGKVEMSAGLNTRFHISPNVDLKFSMSHIDQELGVLRGAVTGNLDDLILALNAEKPNETKEFSYDISTPKHKLSHQVYQAELQYFDDRQSLHLRYSLQENKRKEFDVRKGNDLEIPNIDVNLNSHILDVDWRHPASDQIEGKVGIQYIFKKNSNQPGTNTIPFIPNYHSVSLGMFAIESFTFGNHNIEFGLRFDYLNANIAGREPDNSIYRNELNYSNLSGVIGWKNIFHDQWTFISNFGTAWRPPSIGDLYRFGRREGFIEYGLWRYEILNNDAISTQQTLTGDDKQVNSEVGYKWINTIRGTTQLFELELTGFVNFIDNYIYSRPGGLSRTVRGTAPLYIYDQTDALFLGADAMAKINHSKTFQSDFRFGYVWRTQKGRSGDLAGLPPASINYAFRIEPNISFFDLSVFKIELKYTFKQTLVPRILTVEELLFAKLNDISLFSNEAEDFDISDSPQAFFLTGLSWSNTKGKLNFTIQIENLFNIKYRHYTDRMRYFADDLGRNIIASARFNF